MRIQIDDETAEALKSWMEGEDYKNKSELVLDALEALSLKKIDDIYASARNEYFMAAKADINDLVRRIHRLRLGERIAQIDTMVAYVTAHFEGVESGVNILLRPAVRRKKIVDWLFFWRA